MKHLGIKLTAAIILIVGFFALLGWAGDYDMCEQAILRMSQEDYDSIKALLSENGSEPSQSDIAHWWLDHNRD